jgi:hypothetical protein
MSETVTYRDIEQFLTKELHFKAHHIMGSHTNFKRAGTDVVIVLNPWYEILPQRQIAYIRQMLSQNGILSEHNFDEKLHDFRSFNPQVALRNSAITKVNGQLSEGKQLR